MGLEGKVCIITGGGSGIGRATAIMMAGEGATVVLVGRTASKVEEVQFEIESSGGKATAFGLDVTDERGVKAMVESVLAEHGKIDILLNNAGHSSIHRKLLTTTSEEMKSVFDSNVLGSVLCAQAVVPAMLEAGEGTIINISSLAGVTPGLLAGMAYGAAKAGVINFTQFLNAELRNTGIRASVVIPGEVDTPILDKRPVNPSADARETMVTAEDAAEAITMIARLPSRAAIPELVIRPTYLRDTSAEVGTS